MLGPLRPEERKLCDNRRMQHGTRSDTLAEGRRNFQTSRIC